MVKRKEPEIVELEPKKKYDLTYLNARGERCKETVLVVGPYESAKGSFYHVKLRDRVASGVTYARHEFIKVEDIKKVKAVEQR